jgi:Uma2 family endonuclease
MITPTRSITAEEFHADPRYEYQHYLIDGDVFEDIGNTHRPHEVVKHRLLRQFIQEIPASEAAICPETAYQLGPKTVLVPDISIQVPERPSRSGYFTRSPEVAIEILYPSNPRTELERKTQLYWEHGAKQVWAFDPKTRQAWSITRNGNWIEVETLEVCGHTFQVDSAASIWPL